MATFSPAAIDKGLPPALLRLAAAVIAALAVVGLLLAVVTMVARSNAERDLALKREQHSYDVMVLTRSLDASIARAEAALGRYVVSSDRRTGTIFYDEWRRAKAQLRQLRDLTADEPEQTALVGRLGTVLDDRERELAAAAAFANVRKGWYAVGMFGKAGESPNVGRITTLLSEIAANERERLGQRSQATIFSGERANNFSTLLSVLGLGMVAAALLLGWLAAAAASGRRSADALAEAEGDRATALETAVAERTRELREANAQLKEEAETRARAEAQLAQAQKMEAVGQLTGGIAHDFNNMLAVVVGGLDMARRKFAQKSDETGQYLESAMEGADRASALTRRLLSFARAEPLLPDSVHPDRLVQGMTDLLDRTLGERIAVHTSSGSRVWPIWVDRHQLENAILNLAVNARDAMEGEGRLDIDVRNISVGAGEEVVAGDYARIAVTDTGSGMSEAVRARAFEPFFTTKPAGKGTGLGLSQIFGLVRQSGGDIRIESELGRGTTISLYFPRHATAAGRRERTIPPIATLPGGGTLDVLMVEDDSRVHAATRAALTELGHRVTGCASGQEALALLEGGIRLDLLMTDVMMPGMTGPELVARAHAVRPDVAVLFVTGYVGEAGQADDFAGHEVLRKPFTIAALGGAIDKAMARQVRATPGVAAA
ncbi:ATP-binding protein [Sphingomonas montanisoli]|uniref:histidine kinase n=1 Tax=Sphingomonas montanisoli TaxID=2606412 RepID=A0A5D9CDR7_9SPHN|nr:ATP-binding protein [Sphingomonas montanisoli]TZG29332.1 response regulator [Sphingomonas montanisoli]